MPALAQGPAFPSGGSSRYGHDEQPPAAWQTQPREATAPSRPADGDWWRVAQQPEQPQADSSGESAQPSPPADSLQSQVANEQAEQWASQFEAIATQQDAAKKRNEELEEEKKAWEDNVRKLASEGLTERPPYSFLLLDKARDEVASETQGIDALKDTIETAEDAVAQAKTDQKERDRLLHRAKDALEKNEDAAAELELADAAAEAQHALELAEKTLELRRLELTNLQLEQRLQTLRLVHAQKMVELYEQDFVFTRSMLYEVLGEIDAQEKTLKDQAKEIDDDLKMFLTEQLYEARRQLDEARASQDQSKLPMIEAEFQAKSIARQTALVDSQLIGDQQERLKRLDEAWERRYALATRTVASADMTKWITETKATLERLQTDADNARSKIESLRKQIAAVDRKLQATDESQAAVRYWLTKSSASLQQQRKLYEDVLMQIEPSRRVFEKLLDELTSGALTVQVRRWMTEGWQRVERVWDYGLVTVDTERITVGKIIQGVILLFLGIYASRIISRSFGRRMLARMGVDASAIAALQSVAFYILVLMFTLFALKLVKVPLTAFTVLGGALALGIGFGSQNIVNNFISGLILLAERPVKVGDLIQLEDLYGNVEHIGARSTRVRTGDNLEIIVPNSTFLETNVVNWTLSDNNMRTHVIFGVIYGSPLGKVSHLALKAAANHDRVFDRPEPFVIFTDFGDNALVFELHFWVAVRTLIERRRIESDLRFNLDHLFREAGIVIAFPQRDVHLFADKPLQVQMAPPPEPGTPAAPGAA